jgi:hypothetical protein
VKSRERESERQTKSRSGALCIGVGSVAALANLGGGGVWLSKDDVGGSRDF